jgi:hypothetical protein
VEWAGCWEDRRLEVDNAVRKADSNLIVNWVTRASPLKLH